MENHPETDDTPPAVSHPHREFALGPKVLHDPADSNVDRRQGRWQETEHPEQEIGIKKKALGEVNPDAVGILADDAMTEKTRAAVLESNQGEPAEWSTVEGLDVQTPLPPADTYATSDRASDRKTGLGSISSENQPLAMTSPGKYEMQSGDIKVVADTLLSYPKLMSLCATALSRFGAGEFCWSFEEMLRSYAWHLKMTARGSRQTQAAALLDSMAGRVADEILRVVLSLHDAVQLEDSSKQGLETHLATIKAHSVSTIVANATKSNDPADTPPAVWTELATENPTEIQSRDGPSDPGDNRTSELIGWLEELLFHWSSGYSREEIEPCDSDEDWGCDEERPWVPENHDDCGPTELLQAARRGLTAVVKVLLKTETSQVNINSKDETGQTPLSLATRYGCDAVVKLLLETGQADINSKDNRRRTPLWWAIRNGHEGGVKLLLETGQVDINSRDIYGRTPLLRAAMDGHEAAVKLLLETGQVDINSRDMFGRTPLLRAAMDGHEAVVKVLLQTGQADINSRDNYGRTPLLWAATNGHEAVVKVLLQTGQADMDLKDENGKTPLFHATKRDFKAVKLLLERSQDEVKVAAVNTPAADGGILAFPGLAYSENSRNLGTSTHVEAGSDEISQDSSEGPELSGESKAEEIAKPTDAETRADLTLWEKLRNTFEFQMALRFITDTLYKIADLFVPSAKRGYKRLRWRCSCGTLLWADFANSDPDALRELLEKLHHVPQFVQVSHQNRNVCRIVHVRASEAVGRPSRGIQERTPTGSGVGIPELSQSSGPRNLGTAALRHGSSMHAQLSDYGQQPSGADNTSTILSPSQRIVSQKPQYFEVCVNTGNYAVRLREIDLALVTSDRDLFNQIWSRYRNTRGYGIRRIFFKPRDIHFVKFSISHAYRDLAGIHEKPREYPPQEEVNQDRYHYRCPKMLMPANIFLHFLNHARTRGGDGHLTDDWLQYLPKKCNTSILDDARLAREPYNGKIVIGWGVHIVEGANQTSLALILLMWIAVAVVASTVLASIPITKDQAFGVGQFVVAIGTCGMAAIYFYLEDR